MRLSVNRNRFSSCGLAELSAAGILFWAVFLILFYRLSECNALPGKYDSWFHLALFEEWKIRWKDWLKLGESVYCMWPAKGITTYGEPSPLMAPVFWFCKWLWGNALQGFYGFTSLLFALNALGGYYLGKTLSGKVSSAILLAVVIGFSNFSFAQIDHQNAYFWGAALAGLTQFYVYLKSSRQRNLMYYVFWTIVQLYLSTTVFTYYFLISVLFFLVYLPKLLSNSKLFFQMLIALVVVTVLSAPMVYNYLFSGLLKEVYNPSANAMAPYVSNLHWSDIWRAAPGNLWISQEQTSGFTLLSQIRSAYPGISLLLAAAAGFWGCRKSRLHAFSVVLFGMGLMLSVGAEIQIGAVHIPMPMKWFYEGIGGDTFCVHQ